MAGGDLVEHELTENCVCGPTALPVKDETDGSVGWVYVHHSLDGRELAERGERIPVEP